MTDKLLGGEAGVTAYIEKYSPDIAFDEFDSAYPEEQILEVVGTEFPEDNKVKCAVTSDPITHREMIILQMQDVNRDSWTDLMGSLSENIINEEGKFRDVVLILPEDSIITPNGSHLLANFTQIFEGNNAQMGILNMGSNPNDVITTWSTLANRGIDSKCVYPNSNSIRSCSKDLQCRMQDLLADFREGFVDSQEFAA